MKSNWMRNREVCRLVGALISLLFLATQGATQVDTQGLPPELAGDSWLESLPREGIVGDLPAIEDLRDEEVAAMGTVVTEIIE